MNVMPNLIHAQNNMYFANISVVASARYAAISKGSIFTSRLNVDSVSFSKLSDSVDLPCINWRSALKIESVIITVNSVTILKIFVAYP